MKACSKEAVKRLRKAGVHAGIARHERNPNHPEPTDYGSGKATPATWLVCYTPHPVVCSCCRKPCPVETTGDMQGATRYLALNDRQGRVGDSKYCEACARKLSELALSPAP